MKRRTLIITILLHAALLIVVYVFQGMVFTSLRLFGYVPLLLPIAGTGVAVYEGRYTGGVVGIFAGILCDVSFNEPAGVFTILLTLTGLFVGYIADTIMTRSFFTFVVSCAFVLAVSTFAQMFELLFFVRTSIQPLISTALRQNAYSLLFTLPIWFSVRSLGKRAVRVSPSKRPM